MPAWPERFAQALDIGNPVGFVRQKMKCGTIMPYVIALSWFPSDHIGNDPAHPCSRWSQTCLRRSESRFCQVENSHVLETLINQGINESRSSPADIDNG